MSGVTVRWRLVEDVMRVLWLNVRCEQCQLLATLLSFQNLFDSLDVFVFLVSSSVLKPPNRPIFSMLFSSDAGELLYGYFL